MKRFMQLNAVLWLSILLAGCGIGLRLSNILNLNN